MERKIIEELILKFNAGQASGEEIRKIEQLLESGEIELHQLAGTDLQDKVANLDYPSPTAGLDDRFYQMLALERKAKGSFSWREFFSWPELAPKLALASVMLVIGVGIGYLMRPAETSEGNDMRMLSQQVSDLKEMMMLSMLEKESATDRLKAVSLSRDIDEASAKVTSALVETLNHDENINVRLAALDALKPYARQSEVRQELIRSIAKQESPLVQISLAELMVQLQAKSSVKELEKLIESETMPPDVKKKIKESIDVLI